MPCVIRLPKTYFLTLSGIVVALRSIKVRAPEPMIAGQ